MKKMLIFVILIVVLTSCKKNKETVYPDYLLAGQTSGAGILYTDVVPNDTLINGNQNGMTRTIDINHDGTDDFKIEIYQLESSGFGSGRSSVTPLNTNELAGTATDNTSIDTLQINDSINKNLHWSATATDLYSWSYDQTPHSYHNHGLWGDRDKLRDNYIGVRFMVGDQMFYGWISLIFINQIGSNYWVIMDYACTVRYER